MKNDVDDSSFRDENDVDNNNGNRKKTNMDDSGSDRIGERDEANRGRNKRDYSFGSISETDVDDDGDGDKKTDMDKSRLDKVSRSSNKKSEVESE